MADKLTKSKQYTISSQKLMVGGAIAIGVAAAVAVAVGLVAYNQGKKKAPVCPDPNATRTYNFYPGVDIYSGLANVAYGSADMEQLKMVCDHTAGCVGYNSNKWISNSALNPSQWFAHRSRYGAGSGSYIVDSADPYSAINSPNDPWVYFPGCAISNVQDEVEVFNGTLDELKKHAQENGHIAFSDDGKMYDVITTKNLWNVQSNNSLYV
jgi:hypothetical protein